MKETVIVFRSNTTKSLANKIKKHSKSNVTVLSFEEAKVKNLSEDSVFIIGLYERLNGRDSVTLVSSSREEVAKMTKDMALELKLDTFVLLNDVDKTLISKGYSESLKRSWLWEIQVKESNNSSQALVLSIPGLSEDISKEISKVIDLNSELKTETRLKQPKKNKNIFSFFK